MTEAPAIESTTTEAPATEAPTTDAPVTDAPVTDAPAPDTGDNGSVIIFTALAAIIAVTILSVAVIKRKVTD